MLQLLLIANNYSKIARNCIFSLGSDWLLNYLDIKHEDADNSWCEKLPEEILYKHAAHVFKLSLELVDNN